MVEDHLKASPCPMLSQLCLFSLTQECLGLKPSSGQQNSIALATALRAQEFLPNTSRDTIQMMWMHERLHDVLFSGVRVVGGGVFS